VPVPRGRGTSRRGAGRSGAMLAVVWLLVAAAVVVIGLGAAATLVLVRSDPDEIPRVSDIVATRDEGSVLFAWEDPGLLAGDTYVIVTDTASGGDTSQQTGSRFVVADTDGRTQVCVTVSVNRDGRTGDPSVEACASGADG
jgi:hypothetical protein